MTTDVARYPCSTTPNMLHHNRATSRAHDMHRSRATSQTFETHDLARFFVQGCTPESCTTAVQLTLHGCGATKDNTPTYVGKDNPNPVMHCVQDGRFPLPNLTANHLDQTSHRRNQLTARAEIGADRRVR